MPFLLIFYIIILSVGLLVVKPAQSGNLSPPNGNAISPAASSGSGGVSIGSLGTTGTGTVVLSNTPTLINPNIGSASGSLTGNASTATALATPRGIGIGGTTGLTATPINFDGSTAISPLLTGVLSIANGGTGQNTALSALDALSGTQIAGKYLRSDGTHTTLSSLSGGDIPTLNQSTTGNAVTSTTASNAQTVSVANNATYYLPLFSSTTNGSQAFNLNSSLSYNPSTHNLSTTTFTGALVGNADTATTASGAATLSTTDDTSTNATYYPIVQTASGANPAKVSSTKLTYNPSTGMLTSTSINAGTTGTTSPFQVGGVNALWQESATYNESIGDSGMSTHLNQVGGANNGRYNTGVGYHAMNVVTTGYHNAALGDGALALMTTGINNTAMGSGALTVLTSGGSNVAIGNVAGNALTTGGNNVAVGNGALTNATTSSNNVAIGSGTIASAGTGHDNVAVGYSVMNSTGPGSYNVGIGSVALNNMYSATDNVGIGWSTLSNLNSGTGNVGIGTKTLTYLTTGSSNVGVGYYALSGINGANTTNSTALGYRSGSSNSTGNNNIYLGYGAGYNGGTGATTTGGSNIIIGYNTIGSSATASNELRLADAITATGLYGGTPAVTIPGSLSVSGSLSQGTVLSCATGLTTNASGAITGCVASDRNLKKDVAPLSYESIAVMGLHPVNYRWIDAEGKDTMLHSGFIAQEVETVVPGAVVSAGGGGIKGIDANGLIAVLVLEVQALRRRVDEMEKKK